MLILPGIAMALQLQDYLADENWLLTAFALATLALQVWIIVEAIIAWPKARGVLEPALAPLPVRGDHEGGRSC